MSIQLVTGGAGFIGGHIVEALVARGDEVRVLDDLSTGRLENLRGVRDRVTFVEGSVCDAELVARLCDGVTSVFHLAAIPSVPRSVEDPLGVNEVNVTGSLHVLEGARLAGAQRVVLSASCAAYGNSDRLPSVEDQPLDPLSPYAISKIVDEMYAKAYTDLKGTPAVALRYFNVYGPRQDPNGAYAAVIPKFITAIRDGGAPVLHGTGEQTRDFVFVGDVVRANLLAATAEAAPGRVYNIGSGEQRSLRDLLAALEKAFDRRVDVVHEPGRLGDVMHSRADISRAMTELGYRPATSFDEGLAVTVRAFLDAGQRGGQA